MLLDVVDLEAGYGPLQVVWGVSISVNEGELVGLVGPNGAGKSTTLRTVAGLLKPMAGRVTFMGKQIEGLPAHEITRLGISFVPETLNLFPKMSVLDNLLLGAYTVRDKRQIGESMDRVLDLFPRLAERRRQLAGTLSGGERKMLAIGRGLMVAPKIILVDEPSLGLAPKLVLSVFEALQTLNRNGMAVLLVEQNVTSCLHLTNRCYVLEQGRVVLHGDSSQVALDSHVKEAYLGTAQPVQTRRSGD